ncbi:DNA-protecting protein DprA [Pseudoflavitalea sp. G-6-1-2]|uniref:DNA-processing protein DprA n=1 Tax=Pseudoflavitalea sp. G-6-1-2 TaxID=2728841 RepID=UPI00146D10BC|nr:DNA-processing protein DprA [Pseudoflavitalea sp. G-6-1-2]NML22697.1 DNA-protecting protein DprA [Pseudoflavitalea sp. G-6-1-2]
MNNDLLYQISLSIISNIGNVQAKILAHHFDTAEAIFRAPLRVLEKLEGIGPVRGRAIRDFRDFASAEREIKFIEQYGIRTLYLNDTGYPKRLLHCFDPPTILYCKGSAELNFDKSIAIIGTRSNSQYGKKATETIIRQLAEQLQHAGKELLIVSGLAFGIDAVAHATALELNIPTVGVLAHGLNTLYPKEHSALARKIIQQQGALITEFSSQEQPDKYNFPVRNRIVAGLCDATIVIETGVKGGSMITADLAHGYNRDVFAVPGKITDAGSAGCNKLIRQNKAMLLSDAAELMDAMGWKKPEPAAITAAPKALLFPDLNEQETVLVEMLRLQEPIHLEEFSVKTRLSPGTLAGALLNLEMMQVIESLPGKRYKLR